MLKKYSELLVVWALWEIRKKIVFILLAALISSFVAMHKTRKLPRQYTATTRVIYGADSGGGGGASAMMPAGLSGILALGGSKGVSGILIKEIIESKSMAYDVIDHFDLVRKMKVPNRYLAYLKLRKMIRVIDYQIKTIVELSVTAYEPALAMEMTNFYVENLTTMNKRLKLSTDKELVKVLDPAEEPLYPSGPFVKKNMITAFIGTALIMSFLVVIVGLIRKRLIEGK